MRPHPSFMLVGAGLPGLALSASPTSASYSGAYDGASHTTNSVTVSATNLVSGESISSASWSLVSGSGVAATAPGSVTSAFSGTPPGENTTVSGTMRCTVTTNFGRSQAIDVAVSIHAGLAALNINASPGSYGNTNVPSGSAFTYSCSVTVTNGTPNYAYTNSTPVGSTSPNSATISSNTFSFTLTVPSQPAGTHQTFSVDTSVTDGVGRTGVGQSTFTLIWV